MEFGRKHIKVGPYAGLTYEVSEGRAELIAGILEQMRTEQAKYERFSDIPRNVLGDLRRRKTEALIEFNEHVPDSFYAGKDFPVSVVEDALIFFTAYVGMI
jgi:hypothetical protein